MHGETSAGGRETYCLGFQRGPGVLVFFQRQLGVTLGRTVWAGTALRTQNLVLLATERGGIWAGWLREAKRVRYIWKSSVRSREREPRSQIVEGAYGWRIRLLYNPIYNM